MRKNRERDERSTALAEQLGWSVIRVWEHEVNENVEAAVDRVVALVGDGRAAGQ